MYDIVALSVFWFVLIIELSTIFSSEVHISGNTTTEAYNNGSMLNCSVRLQGRDAFLSIALFAQNKTTGTFKEAAGSYGVRHTQLTTFGVHLFGENNTLLIYEESVHSLTLMLNNITCRHERLYRCYLTVRPFENSTPKQIKSDIMSISVTVIPSKPEISHPVLENSMTKMKNKSQTDLKRNKRSTQSWFEDNEYEKAFIEGDNITIMCFGDVGRPKGRFVWEKIYSEERKSNYSNFSTEIIPDACSNNGTSSLTIQVTADDNHARIRCLVKSEVSEETVYADTETLLIYYEVGQPIISAPTQTFLFIEGHSLRLKCKADGNPKPLYSWTKGNSTNDTLAYLDILVIEETNLYDSGFYTCEVKNVIGGQQYTKSVSEYIKIVKQETVTVYTQMIIISVSCASGVLLIIIVYAIVLCYNRQKKSTHSLSQTTLETNNISLSSVNCEREDSSPSTGEQRNNEFEEKRIQPPNKEKLSNQHTACPNTEYSTVDNTIRNTHLSCVSKAVKEENQNGESPYANPKEDVYDISGDRRHLKLENNYDTMTSNPGLPFSIGIEKHSGSKETKDATEHLSAMNTYHKSGLSFQTDLEGSIIHSNGTQPCTNEVKAESNNGQVKKKNKDACVTCKPGATGKTFKNETYDIHAEFKISTVTERKDVQANRANLATISKPGDNPQRFFNGQTDGNK